MARMASEPVFVVLVSFSGLRREFDVEDALYVEAISYGIKVLALSVDTTQSTTSLIQVWRQLS